MAEKKPVSFRFPEPLITKLKARAEEEGVTVTELISRFSQQGLDGSVQERLAVLEQKVSTSTVPASSIATGAMSAGAGKSLSLAQGIETDGLDGFLSQDDWYQQLVQLKQRQEQLIQQVRQFRRANEEIADLSRRIAWLEVQAPV
jgi:hypothetical protein